MALFSLLVKLGLDSSSFDAGVKKADSAVSGFARSTLGSVKGQLAAAFSIGAVTAFGHSIVEAADRVGDLADQMSLSTEEVQKLDIAAKRSGVEVEQMGNMFLKVGEYRKKAGEGDQDAVDMLAKMGVSLADIQNRSLSNKDIAEKIAGWYGNTAKTAKDQADLVEIAGTKSEKLLAVLAAMHDLGPVKIFSEEDIAAISKFKDASEDFKRNMMVAAAPGVGFWANVLNKANANERENPDRKFNFTRALWSEMVDDGTDQPTKPILQKELADKRAKLAEDKMDLFAEKFTGKQDAGYKRAFGGGGDMTSIGGMMTAQFDTGQAVREMSLSSKQTAQNTAAMKEALMRVVSQ